MMIFIYAYFLSFMVIVVLVVGVAVNCIGGSTLLLSGSTPGSRYLAASRGGVLPSLFLRITQQF
jgi:hypothetical protein